MSFWAFPPSQARKPFAEILPDGRRRVTFWIRATTTGTTPIELGGTGYTVNTAYPWPSGQTPADWQGLRLTYLQMDEDSRGFPQGGDDSHPLVRIIYEQISQTGITRVGANVFTQLPDGRAQVVQEWVMFSTSTYTPEVPGTTTPSGLGTYYLWTEEAPNDGTLRRITRTYQTAGTVSTDDESLQGGALLLKKIESFKTVPATPSGYTPVGTPVQNPSGYPVYTYTFAKGNGALPVHITGREDGSLVYLESALGPSAATPSYSGSGTGYLVDLVNRAEDGYYYNAATYIKPQGYTLNRTVNFTVPGLATAANPPTFDPPITRRLKALVTVAFSTTQNTATAYSVVTWAQLNENYTLTDGTQQSTVRALDGYVGSSSYSASNVTYRGLDVSVIVVTVSGSSPTSKPSGATTLDADSEIYLTQTNGTIVYRNTTITFTF